MSGTVFSHVARGDDAKEPFGAAVVVNTNCHIVVFQARG